MAEETGSTSGEVQRGRKGQVLTIALILLAVGGLVVATDLTHMHYMVNSEADFQTNCNYAEAVNCEDVAASSYSVVLGVPISSWGMFAYVVLLGLALLGTRAGESGYAGYPGFVLLWALAGAAGSALLAYVAYALITSVCVKCAALYVINLGVLAVSLLLAWRTRGGPLRALGEDLRRARSKLVVTAPVLAGLAAVALALILFYPQARMSHIETLALPTGHECGADHHTDEGFPYFGAHEALVTIEEFSDYQCPHCARAHQVVRELVEEFGDRVRLVHRHFPLDEHCHPKVKRPFHPDACLAAKAAICADKQRKFWPYNDLLYANRSHLKRKHLVAYAEQAGLDKRALESCLVDPKVDAELQRDIRDGIGWGVRGTPSFVINGKLVVGAKPGEFRRILEEELQHCQKP